MSIITPSWPSPGGLVFVLLQVGLCSCLFIIVFSWMTEYYLTPFLTHFPFQVVWEHSMPCLTVSSMLSCIHITVWLQWAPATRSTCGGRNTSLQFSWYVSIDGFFFLPFFFFTVLNFACFCYSPAPVCYGNQPHLPVFLHEGVPIPVPHLHLHRRLVRPDFLVPLPQLLVPCLHQRQEAA